MRQAVARLVSGLYREGGDPQALAHAVSQRFRGDAFVLEVATGAVRAAARRQDFAPIVQLHDLQRRVLELIAGLQRSGAAPDAAWRKVAGVVRGRDGDAGQETVHVAVGVPSTDHNADLMLVVCRALAFSVSEVDHLGELAFHVSLATATRGNRKATVRALSPLASLWIVDDRVENVCTRMTSLLSQLPLGERGALHAIGLLARRALQSGMVREVFDGTSGRRLAFVAVPVAFPKDGAAGVSPEEGVVVFAYDVEAAFEMPARHLRALHPISAQQAAVAHVLVNGMTIDQAAEALEVSSNTVRTHVSALFRNVGVTNRADLARVLVQEMVAIRSLEGAGFAVLQRTRRRWSSERLRAARADAGLARRIRGRAAGRSGRTSPRLHCSEH